MENILPESETTEIESRVYANPQARLDRTNAFIDNWREAQSMLNQQNTDATRMLGTDVPTVEGGLTGADSYFASRYQTPQTNSLVADLRATAQAQALNDVLANEQAAWKQRYQNAYRNYQKRQYDRANSLNSSGLPNTTGTPSTTTGGYETVDNSNDILTADDAGGYVTSKGLEPGSSRMVDSLNGYFFQRDTLSDGRTVITNTDDPDYVRASDGYFYKVPETTTVGPFSFGASDADRQARANNASQLEKIRYYYNQQRNN
jgi:hypothetical protein